MRDQIRDLGLVISIKQKGKLFEILANYEKQNRDKQVAPRHLQKQFSWQRGIIWLHQAIKCIYTYVCVHICTFFKKQIDLRILFASKCLQSNRKQSLVWFQDSSFIRLPGLSSCRGWEQTRLNISLCFWEGLVSSVLAAAKTTCGMNLVPFFSSFFLISNCLPRQMIAGNSPVFCFSWALKL